MLGTFQSAFWYTHPPASQRSNKKQTLLAPFFSPGNRSLSRQKQWSQGHKTRKEKHSSDSISAPPSRLHYNSDAACPFPLERKIFPSRLSTVPARSLDILPSTTANTQTTASKDCAVTPVLAGVLTTLAKSLAGPSMSVIHGTTDWITNWCWSLLRKCAHSVHVRLYSKHRGWNNSAPCPLCTAKAYGCFASKTVDLSFASDIPQSAYNSALADQPSNLPLWGMCQPSKGVEEVCCIVMAFVSSDLLS